MVTFSKPVDDSKAASSAERKHANAILPLLEETSSEKLRKDKCSSFKLRTTPSLATSATYEETVPHFGDGGTMRECIKAYHNIYKVCTGLNATTAVAKKKIAEAILKEEPLKVFSRTYSEREERTRQAAVQAEATANHGGDIATMTEAQIRAARNSITADVADEWVKQSLFAVIAFVAPVGALDKVKSYIRRECRKPRDMKVKHYASRLVHINEVEIPLLPPNHNDEQMFTDQEIIEILHHSLPNSWKREATSRGFDPFNGQTVQTVVEFYENLEAADEGFEQVKKPSSKKKTSPSKQKSGDRKRKKFYCKHHGENSTHDTSDCKVLNNGGGGSPHKKWSRRDQDKKRSSSETKKELATFIAKSVRKSVRAEMNSISKKKRRIEDDSSSDESMNAVDKRQGKKDDSDSDDDSVDWDTFDFNNLELNSDEGSIIST